MPGTDIKKAQDLLKEALLLLKHSESKNLQESAHYLEESLHWLNQHKPGTGSNER